MKFIPTTYNTFLYTGIRWLWLAFVVFAIDFGSKQWVINHVKLGEYISIIPNIQFFYTLNSGAAFSILADKGNFNIWLLTLIAIILCILLLVMMYYANYMAKIINVSYALILGGALGNLFDRIKYGAVIDFIDIYVQSWHWPTFNIADLSICIGIILIVLEHFYSPAK